MKHPRKLGVPEDRRHSRIIAASVGPHAATPTPPPAWQSFDVITGSVELRLPTCGGGALTEPCTSRAQASEQTAENGIQEQTQKDQSSRSLGAPTQEGVDPKRPALPLLLLFTRYRDQLGPEAQASVFVAAPGPLSMQPRQRRSRPLWCNLVVYFNSTNLSKKLQNTRMERTQDSQFFLFFLLFVYIVSSHGDYSYIQ